MPEAAADVLEQARTELATYQEDRKIVRQTRGQPEPGLQPRAFRMGPEIPSRFSTSLMEYESETNELLLFWGGYEYPVDLDEIETPLQLLGWVNHLGQKAWDLATSDRIAAFVETVCKTKGWDLHGG